MLTAVMTVICSPPRAPTLSSPRFDVVCSVGLLLHNCVFNEVDTVVTVMSVVELAQMSV